MMRIVDVNPYFYPFFGGIEHRMHLIAKELVARGHDVTIVTGQLPGTATEEVSEDGYRIVRLPSKYIKFYTHLSWALPLAPGMRPTPDTRSDPTHSLPWGPPRLPTPLSMCRAGLRCAGVPSWFLRVRPPGMVQL